MDKILSSSGDRLPRVGRYGKRISPTMPKHFPKRPAIPSDMKREVRRRCGFGCVICGLPLYEYEHMEEWAIVRRHQADELTLLCDRHHKEKTNRLLSIEDVKAANERPFNLIYGASSPYKLHYRGSNTKIEIGGNLFFYDERHPANFLYAISIDCFPIIGFNIVDGNLLLNLNLFDELDRPVLSIIDNELVYQTDIWDIQFIANRLTICQGLGKIFVEMIFEPSKAIIINRARLFKNGIEISVKPEYISVPGGPIFSENQFFGAGYLINAGYSGACHAAILIETPNR